MLIICCAMQVFGFGFIILGKDDDYAKIGGFTLIATPVMVVLVDIVAHLERLEGML
jgi:hypothetical protein